MLSFFQLGSFVWQLTLRAINLNEHEGLSKNYISILTKKKKNIDKLHVRQ